MKVVKHRKTHKKYRVLGTHYDGNRGHLYRLISIDEEDKRHIYDNIKNYVVDRRRR